jgi:hypothetical protein
VPAEQFFPVAQGAQFGPPQSVSTSPSFITPSMHEAAWQNVAVQTPAAQSAGSLQWSPVLQGEQVPPQSASVSAPFITVSSQRGARHKLFAQTPSMQSDRSLHPPPDAHDGHTGPPQSMPVSCPSRVLFLQDAGAGFPPSPEEPPELDEPEEPPALAFPPLEPPADAASMVEPPEEPPPPPAVVGFTSSTGAKSVQASAKHAPTTTSATASELRSAFTAHLPRRARRRRRRPRA